MSNFQRRSKHLLRARIRKMSEKKCWAKEEVAKLILRWESFPELWDIKTKEYRNKIKKQNAYKILAAEFNCCESEIIRKIHNLRTQFHQELRKSHAKRSGDGADQTYHSNWEYFRSLLFIHIKDSDARTLANLETETRVQNATGDEIADRNKLIDSDEENERFRNVQKKRRKNAKQSKDDYVLAKTMRVIEKPVDEFQVFGDFVACELRNLQSREKQMLLKRMIQRTILQVSESDGVGCSVTSLIAEHPTPTPSVASWTNSRSASASSSAASYSNSNLRSPEKEFQREPHNILKLSGES